MLLKSLLNRLTGGTDIKLNKPNASTSRFPSHVYNQYPRLPDIIVQLLQTHQGNAADSQTLQRTFAALEIIERLGLPSRNQQVIKELLKHQLGNPVWNVREKTAKALSVLETSVKIEELLTPFFVSEPPQNLLHGQILFIKYLLELGPEYESEFPQRPSRYDFFDRKEKESNFGNILCAALNPPEITKGPLARACLYDLYTTLARSNWKISI